MSQQALIPRDVTAEHRLSFYDAARHALSEAYRVDEVKEIRNRAIAMQEYARQANDTELLRQATEIRLRAERRWGEIYGLSQKAEGTRSDVSVLSGGVDRVPPEDSEIPTLQKMGISKTQSAKWQALAALPEDKFKIRVDHAKARVAGATTSAPSYSKAEYSGENEWFTPAPWVEKAREALGGIDLDPASHALAQETVRAKAFFTAADNGLERPWAGRVWLNPPYSRALLSPFVDKLVGEYTRGTVEQAILLTHNYTDTEWFHAAAGAASVICFPRGRIHFLAPSGEDCSPTQGQAFFYFGFDDAAFRRTFAELGLIARLL
jgi:phage N-6-adenine-methyltransferase